MLSKVHSTEESTNKKEIGDINGSHYMYFVCDLYKEQRCQTLWCVMSDTLVYVMSDTLTGGGGGGGGEQQHRTQETAHEKRAGDADNFKNHD